MEFVEIDVNGKKEEVVIKLPKELKDDCIIDESLENTLELDDIISVTKELNLNNE